MRVDPAAVVPQPWRNGRGVTRELVVGPGWRASVADLVADGPFSTFDGVQRVFVPLAGGFGLVVDGAEVAAVAHQPIRFPGEAQVELRGLTEPTRALNLMTYRGAWDVDVRVVPQAGTADGAHPATLLVSLGDHVAEVHLTPQTTTPRSSHS